MRLMGVTPHDPPETGCREVHGIAYEVETISANDTAVSLFLSRDRLIVPPQVFEKDPDEPPRGGTRVDHCVGALFQRGVTRLEVGTGGDRLAALLPHYVVAIDTALEHELVALMIQLRDDVTGEANTAVPAATPGAPDVTATIEVEGKQVQFELSDCRVETDEGDGTFGNIDLTVVTSPPLLHETVGAQLRIRIPGYDELLDATGYEPIKGGMRVGFALLSLAASLGHGNNEKRLHWLRETIANLTVVEVVWQGADTVSLGVIQ